MISIQQINYIVILSEELNFIRASEKCFVTQPTLSMQIKKAEEQLGSKIFNRDSTPLQLTSFGKELVPVLRAVQSEYDNIEMISKKASGSYREVVRLGVIPTISSYLIPDLYEKWRSELQDIQLIIEELKTDDLLDYLDQGKLDVGILSGPHHSSRLRTIPLFIEEIKAYYPKGEKSQISTNELAEMHPWLLTPGNCLRTQMMHFCQLKNENENDDWDYQGGNIDLLIQMVDRHGGYTLVPENHIKQFNSNYKSIVSETGEFPAREIIALVLNRTQKWASIERIIRECQLKYVSVSNKKVTTLSWT